MGDLEPGDALPDAASARLFGDHWVFIQLNTFTNWVKDQLTDHDEATVDDLRSDFSDGVRLCALVEALQHRRVPHVVKRPINQHQCLDNINLALKAMTGDGIKLVNIGAEDIYGGNLKLILGMVWCLILRYQIGRGKTPPKKLMLAWINAVTPGQSVTNFSTDWNDGVALHGIVEYCRPGTFPQWNQLSRRDRLRNCQDGMEAAKVHFNIPMVLKPENLSNPDLDELSGMTYLSYFMKVNSPGYAATLKWVQRQIPHMNVKNFQTDWNDGKVLVALVESLGGVIVGGVEHGTGVDILQRAMNAAKSLGVDPVVSAKEMSDPDVDHIGVMAYAARLESLTPKNKPSSSQHRVAPTAVSSPPPGIELHKEELSLAEAVKIVPSNQPAYVNKKYEISLNSTDAQSSDRRVHVSVAGPSTRPSANLKWQGHAATCDFIPLETGTHKICVYNKDVLVKNCPLLVNVLPDVSQIRILSSPTNAAVGQPSSIKIGSGGGGDGGGGLAANLIRAHARSPNGQTVPLEVTEKDGALTCGFTPTSSGVWTISILCNGQHVQGSPFPVNVSDPRLVRVSGIERKISGKAAHFLVKTSGAGSGQLTVNVSHNGRPVQSQIVPEGLDSHRVSFLPAGAGSYVIHVYYSGIEVEGSPFTMEVVDAGNIVATGQGVSTAKVNHRSTFFLNLGHSGSSADVKAHITSPQGVVVPVNIDDSQNGNVTIGYVPTEIGDHRIEVSYCGQAIRGSPFHASVCDPTKIKIVDLPQRSTVGTPVEFEIDASQSGNGNLEITVNNGSVPCVVRRQDAQRYVATFVPQEPAPHSIHLTFNETEVPGSPWTVNVHNPLNVTFNSDGIRFIPVGKLAEFEVQVGGDDGSSGGQLGVNVTSPSHRPVHANIVNTRNGFHRIEFLPTEVGSHCIEVLYNRTVVSGTPVVAKAYDTSAITVTPVSVGVIGRPVEFTIDVSQAGEGQLEIMVNRATVPHDVHLVRKGVYLISFVPTERRPHLVDVLFNKEPLPRGVLSIPVMDPGHVGIAKTEDVRPAVANRQSFLKLDNSHAILERDLTVKVTSPSGELVPAKIVWHADGEYKVEYSSKFTGRHTVEILHNGEAIMGSPFYVEIYDPNKIRVEGSRTGEVGGKMEFDVICFEAGKASLKMNIIGPRGTSVPYEISSIPLGEHVTYMPRDPGIYEIYMTYGGLEVPGCPIRQDVTDTSQIVAEGEGLSRGVEDQVATFCVDSKGQRGDLVVRVDGPNSISKCNVEAEIGRYTVRYVPVEVGEYAIKVTWNGREIEGSPFRPKIVNPRKVELVGGWESILGAGKQLNLKLNEANSLEFDTRHAGPGQMRAEVIGPSGKIPASVMVKERGKMNVSFNPKIEGEYQIRITWNGLELEKCPIVARCLQDASSSHLGLAAKSHRSALHQTNHVSTTESRFVHDSTADGHVGSINLEKMVLTGMGLQYGRVNQQAEFFIDGTHAGPGMPSVRLTGLKGDLLVNCTPVSDHKYRCTYTAPLSGAYLLYISWSDRQVSGSPFKVTVQPATDASKVVCTMDELNSSVVGRDIKATLDIRRAGHGGEPFVQCNGPTRLATCQLIDHYNGTFTLLVRPQESGRHVLQIKYGGEHIIGSPFVLTVAGISDASKVRVYGPGVMDGILATYQSHFTVNTRGAGAGELTIKIRGPRGGFRVEMERQNQKDRAIFCRYDPTEVGEYLIDVRWSGESIPGSPFVAHIFDTHEDLRQFQMEAFQHGYVM